MNIRQRPLDYMWRIVRHSLRARYWFYAEYYKEAGVYNMSKTDGYVLQITRDDCDGVIYLGDSCNPEWIGRVTSVEDLEILYPRLDRILKKAA